MVKAAQNDNIVDVHYTSADQQHLHVVMEWLDGPTLLSYLCSHHPMPLDTVRLVTKGVLRALQFIHDNEQSLKVAEHKQSPKKLGTLDKIPEERQEGIGKFMPPRVVKRITTMPDTKCPNRGIVADPSPSIPTDEQQGRTIGGGMPGIHEEGTLGGGAGHERRSGEEGGMLQIGRGGGLTPTRPT
ncbi:unnamed protein product [Vitrella brassicaformis CCMP3155]|uniref:Protein kinase domain-containing protein n=1 Tax=Vitrella brassicaformis (strain CCMP3155) TaxID=1169540 RepID=A0A0G4FRI7_VITBC|nr:unnamed protein product [Vitrella brassicaformis CCMP3155]|eukprot:CEM17234.1 unnamed protein product [Vitrella brassicaformis CCMP3155]